MKNTKLDAIPDLSDTQVIVYAKWDRSPDIMEDQVTYPITSALLGLPKVKDIRGFSDFGYSYVYIIFDEGTDIYWARSRTLEYLNSVTPTSAKRRAALSWRKMPPPSAGSISTLSWIQPDNTASNRCGAYQDWYLRYALQSVPAWPRSLPSAASSGSIRSTSIPTSCSATRSRSTWSSDAIQKSNNDVGGRLVEFTGREYMVRGRGYIKSLDDIGNIVVMSNPQTGTPVLVKDVGHRDLRPRHAARRRGTRRQGEAVGGVVIMRFGENAQKVIERVKAKLTDIEPTLPQGLKIVTTYDRSDLIDRSVDNLKHTLIEELVIVSLVILIFLWHFPSAIIPIITIPVTVILAFIPMQMMRHDRQHHVAGRNRHRHRRHGRCSHRGGRANTQEAGALGSGRAPGRLPRRGDLGRKGSRRTQLLRAARHRRRLPAGVHAGSAGRPPVQAAGIHQELLPWRSRQCWRSRSILPCGCCSRAWITSSSVRDGWRQS